MAARNVQAPQPGGEKAETAPAPVARDMTLPIRARSRRRAEDGSERGGGEDRLNGRRCRKDCEGGNARPRSGLRRTEQRRWRRNGWRHGRRGELLLSGLHHHDERAGETELEPETGNRG